MSFHRNGRMEKGSPKPSLTCSMLGPSDGQMPLALKKRQTTDIPHCTPTHIHAEDTKSMHHSIMCIISHMFTCFLRALWCDMQRNSLPSNRWPPKASAASRSQRSTRKRWLRRLRSGDDMVPRKFERPRDAEAGLCPCFCRLTCHAWVEETWHRVTP